MTVQETIEQMIAEAQSKVTVLETLKADAAAEKVEAYDKGFVDGAASIGSDVVYTESEYLAGIEAATAPLKEQVGTLQGQVDGFAEKLNADVSAAVATLKTELLADYEAAQVAESEGETGFRNKLMI